MSGTMGGKPLNSPRICDMAGFHLNKNWPERYDFDLAASLKVRERQLLAVPEYLAEGQPTARIAAAAGRTIELDPGEANKVMAVEWAEGGVGRTRILQTGVEALKDKRITAGDIVGILTAYTTKPVAGTGGIHLRVRKDEDLTGVTISVRLLAGVAPGEACMEIRGAVRDVSAKKHCWECPVGCSWITRKKPDDGSS